MKRVLLLFVLGGCLFGAALGQHTTIADPNFERALIELGLDAGPVDGVVPTANIRQQTRLLLMNRNIVSLAGIEDFEALESLQCGFNKIAQLDLSSNTRLLELDCSSNLLTQLSLSANAQIKDLNCSSNLLGALDTRGNPELVSLNCSNNELLALNLSPNTKLEQLNCAQNRLSQLDISANKALKGLVCSNNRLAALNCYSNTLLTSLSCASNRLQGLGLSTNTHLELLDCSSNQLADLQLGDNRMLKHLTAASNQLPKINLGIADSLRSVSVSNNFLATVDLRSAPLLVAFNAANNEFSQLDFSRNLLLENVDVSSNKLTSLDLSTQPQLQTLSCFDNSLHTLDLRSANEQAPKHLDATTNPLLRCLLVKNPQTAKNNTLWRIDPSTTYRSQCIAYTYVPDDQFEAALRSYDDEPNDNYIPTENIARLSVLNLSNRNIQELTGIADFVGLTELDVSNNLLSNLSIWGLDKLRVLNCSSNRLSALVLRNAAATLLSSLDARYNPALRCISVYDVEKAKAAGWNIDNTANYGTNCQSNLVFIPDPRFEAALIALGYDSGSLDQYISADSIARCTKLNIRDLSISDLTGIQFFPKLDTLLCSGNELQTLPLDSAKLLQYLDCSDNKLRTLDLSPCAALRVLRCSDNRIATLDLHNNPALELLNCTGNYLSHLDLNALTALRVVHCSSNFMTRNSLQLSQATALTTLMCSNNQLEELVLPPSLALDTIDCSNNNLPQLDLRATPSLRRLNCSMNILGALDVSQQTDLLDLNCTSNRLSVLNLSSNPRLRSVLVGNNLLHTLVLDQADSVRTLVAKRNRLTQFQLGQLAQVDSVDVSNNELRQLLGQGADSLRALLCANNQIDSLSLHTNMRLQYLHCENNLIDSIDLRFNVELSTLSVGINRLPKLDLSLNTNLRLLQAANNRLSALDITTNTALRELNLADNQLTHFDLSHNSLLNTVFVNTNQLRSLVAANGYNTRIQQFNASGNPPLRCIEIDNEQAVDPTWQKDQHAAFANDCRFGQTYVPDPRLEAALSALVGLAHNNDRYIPTAAIDTLRQLDISAQQISDLTGLGDITALQELNCSHNPLTQADFRQNTLLRRLQCQSAQLTSLNIAQNTALENLDASSNALSDLDLSNNTALQELLLANNAFTSIHLQGLGQLHTIDLSNNAIAELTLEDNPLLRQFLAHNNQLVSLDLRPNLLLQHVQLDTNSLSALQLNNGNNAELLHLSALHNPHLKCIEVDDALAAQTQQGPYAMWQTDPSTSFATHCHYGETFIPDTAFEQYLIDTGHDYSSSAPLDHYVPTHKISRVRNLYLPGLGITDLTGLQDFLALTNLNCANNQIQDIPLHQNTQLSILNCAGNQLTQLALQALPLLTQLDCSNNRIAQLDLSASTQLQILAVTGNQLSSLSLLTNPQLTQVLAANNQLRRIEAQNGSNNLLHLFDLRNNPQLRCVLVDQPPLASSYPGWYKDPAATYRTICNDDDNDGISNPDDQCPDTPLGDQVDVFGCSIFSLPPDNFLISSTDETCRGANNGSLSIQAQQIWDYTATVFGPIDTLSVGFTTGAQIRNLRAGSYQLCITLAQQVGYQQCYNFQLKQPDSLFVDAQLSKKTQNIHIQLQGADLYHIYFNGNQYTTTQSQLTLPAATGPNQLVIRTDKSCQGIYTHTFHYWPQMWVYPNPAQHYTTIYLGTEPRSSVHLAIYSPAGACLYTAPVPAHSNTLQLDTAHYPAGQYTVVLTSPQGTQCISFLKQ